MSSCVWITNDDGLVAESHARCTWRQGREKNDPGAKAVQKRVISDTLGRHIHSPKRRVIRVGDSAGGGRVARIVGESKRLNRWAEHAVLRD